MKASIIVPNLEPQTVLLPSVQAMCAQSVDDFEVIFPLFGEVSREEKVILKHFEEQYENFRVLPVKGSRSASLNQAVDDSDGKFVFFVESHCVIDRDWLKRYLARFNKNKFQASFIAIKEVPSNRWISKCVWRQRADVIRRQKDAGTYDAFFDLHGSCVTRELFDSMGQFCEVPAMAEFEFGAKLHQKGIPIYRVADEQIWHYNNRTLSSYENIVKRQGSDRVKLLSKHGREFMERYFPSPKLINFLPLLQRFRLPILCTAQAVMLAQSMGLNLFEKVSPALSESCFRGYAANCLRYGMLKELGKEDYEGLSNRI